MHKINAEIPPEIKPKSIMMDAVDDSPDANMLPYPNIRCMNRPETVLYACRLNPMTDEKNLEVIFSKFGAIK